MTPTLFGRWQTRLLLMTLLGVPITALYTWLIGANLVPFTLLGYALGLGLGWDLLYNYVQSLRWNRDWPPLFALYAGLLEGSSLFVLSQFVMPFQLLPTEPGLPGLPGLPVQVTMSQFWLHYGLVFGATYVASLGLLQVLMPRWRYRGGQWLSIFSIKFHLPIGGDLMNNRLNNRLNTIGLSALAASALIAMSSLGYTMAIANQTNPILGENNLGQNNRPFVTEADVDADVIAGIEPASLAFALPREGAEGESG